MTEEVAAMNQHETNLRLQVLNELKKAGPVRKDELAKLCGLTLREAAKVLSKLEESGLITVGCPEFAGKRVVSRYGLVRLATKPPQVENRAVYRMNWTPARLDAEDFKRHFSRRGDVRIPLAEMRPIGMQSSKPHDHHLRGQ